MRIRCVIDIVSLLGNGSFWFGIWNNSSIESNTEEFSNKSFTLPDTSGIGVKITTSQIIAQTRSRTQYFQSASNTLPPSDSFLLELDYYQSELKVKINNSIVANVNNGPTVDSPTQIHFYGIAPLGGNAGDYARVELKNIEYKITQN